MQKYKTVRPGYWTTYTDETMWEPFFEDVDSARYRVIFQAAFVGVKRMNNYWSRFEDLQRRGVSICIFLQEPEDWRGPNLAPVNYRQALVDGLVKRGAHVTHKPDIHEKLMVIDDSILWDGSLNYLSHVRTKDRIHRFAHPEVVNEAIDLHNLEDCSSCIRNRQIAYATGDARSLLQGLKPYRERAAISQAQLAKRCGSTQSWISRVESGNFQHASVDTLCEFARKARAKPVLIPDMMMPKVAAQLAEFFERERAGASRLVSG